MHTNKTCLVEPGLTEWKLETYNWKTEFNIGFKKSVLCIFNVINLKSTNIGLSSFSVKKRLFHV